MFDARTLSGHRLEEAFDDDRWAILPVGSLEYHGPHGPLGTDTINATGLGREIAEDVDGLLLPPVPYTCCPGYATRYRGTFSIDRDVTESYVEEILEALVRNGGRKVLVLIGHGGAINAVEEVGRRVAKRHPNLLVASVPWWRTLPEGFGESIGFSQRDGGGHGGPRETSAAMCYESGSADLDAAENIENPAESPPESDGITVLSPPTHSTRWQGYHGRIEEASAERGRELVDEARERIVSWMRARDEEALAEPPEGWQELDPDRHS